MNSKPYEIRIIPNETGALESKLADVEIVLHGILPGLKLVGCSVWRSKKGETPTVLVPSKSYATAGGVRYHELLRAEIDGDKKTVQRFKQMIRDEYEWFTGNHETVCERCGTTGHSPESHCAECGNALPRKPPVATEKPKRKKKAAEHAE